MPQLSFAHLSDLHLPLQEKPPRLRDLLSKRLFSYLSWRRSRRRIHRAETLALIMEDVQASGPDHLVITGDLTNLALPDEFTRAERWLASAGGGDSVTVTPGNHDALVGVPTAQGLGRWRAWMCGAAEDGDFPFVKRVGEAALIGVSTAVPTPPFLATGRVGHMQLFRLARLLGTLGAEGAFRIVLIHHPVTEGAVSNRKALDDRAALRQVLSEYGAELVLHGHSHHASLDNIQGPHGPIPVVGAPSASAAPGESSEPAGWRHIGLQSGNDDWEVSVTSRTLQADGRVSVGEPHLIRVKRPPPTLPAAPKI